VAKWHREFEDATKLFTAEVSVDPPEDMYPAMVRYEWELGGSLLDYDAEQLGLLLQEAAAEAKRQNEALSTNPDANPRTPDRCPRCGSHDPAQTGGGYRLTQGGSCRHDWHSTNPDANPRTPTSEVHATPLTPSSQDAGEVRQHRARGRAPSSTNPDANPRYLEGSHE
jgi:hypothetical protein